MTMQEYLLRFGGTGYEVGTRFMVRYHFKGGSYAVSRYLPDIPGAMQAIAEHDQRLTLPQDGAYYTVHEIDADFNLVNTREVESERWNSRKHKSKNKPY